MKAKFKNFKKVKNEDFKKLVEKAKEELEKQKNEIGKITYECINQILKEPTQKDFGKEMIIQSVKILEQGTNVWDFLKEERIINFESVLIRYGHDNINNLIDVGKFFLIRNIKTFLTEIEIEKKEKL